ncbi:MAG: BON domain-containing protein [Steroidobacteraceae bacterium]|nr:BON domain-containing protein [Deltaproteobacteria bacterium]
MKAIYSISIMAAAVAPLAFNVPVQAADPDSRVESSARHSYAFKTYLKGDDIKIRTKAGTVILTGIVSENFHKLLAQETVAGLPGVKSVDNRLEVKGAAPTVNSDAWLLDKVKVALLFHRSVSAAKTEIVVKDGIVTLRGEAAGQAQKDLITEYARDVDGVKDVKNELLVIKALKKTHRTTAEKIDDASITAQVNMTLLNHRSTSVLNTTVVTRHGLVTVGGKAGSAAEKDLVTKIVTDINGVKSVKNRMSVEQPEPGTNLQ